MSQEGRKFGSVIQQEPIATAAGGRAPQGSRMTELGPLPEEWRVMRLQEVTDLARPSGRRRTAWPSQVAFLPMSLLPEDSLYVSQWELRRRSEIRSGIIIENGDFLLAKITPCLENGKQGIVRGLPYGWGLATTEVIAIKASATLVTEFLAFYLKMPAVRQALASKMEGTTGRQRLPKSVVMCLNIPLPPLPEQRAIAYVLRAVQQAKEATEGVIAALRALKKSLMRHLFTYGPVPVDDTDGVELQETEVGLLPKHWRVERLGEVVKQTQYGISRRGERKGKVPILRMNNLVDGKIDTSDLQYLDLDERESEKFCLEKGDILFNRTNSHELVGKTALFDVHGTFVFASYLIRLKPDTRLATPEFLNFYMNGEGTQQRLKYLASRGVSQSNINATKLKGFSIPLPPLSEQHEIAHILQTVDRKIVVEEHRKAALEALLKALLHDLMSAKRRLPAEFVAQFEKKSEEIS